MASIRDVDRKLLWARSGNECAFPDCHQELSINLSADPSTQELSVIGEEAHIVAKEDDGPRGDAYMPLADRNSYNNLILLCPTHHTLVDKEKGRLFSIDELTEMKRDHESYVIDGRHTTATADLRTLKVETLLSELSVSRARLITRWIAVGVEPQLAEHMADDISVGLHGEFADFCASRSFSVLEGDFGSGKSVALEREYQRCALVAMENDDAPFPAYLNAQSIQNDFTQVVDEKLSLIGGPPQRVTVFVDGIDEVGPDRALEIVDELRSWLYSADGRKVLVTSRPDTNLQKRDCMPLPPLSDQELEDLFQRVNSYRGLAWGQSPDVREALHRPLFALIAADCSKVGSMVPNSRGSFLEALVERALNRTSRLNSDMRSLLARLGYLILNSGGPIVARDAGGREDQRRLIETRLVVKRSNSLSFALPVLGQYFAGQYVLENGLPEIIDYSPRRRDQWRDSLTFAVSAGSWESVHALLKDLTSVDPGLATWIVSKAIPTHMTESSVPLPDALECARSLHAALDAWLGGIGNSRVLKELTDGHGHSAPLGIGVDREQIGYLNLAFFDPAKHSSPERAIEITTGLDWQRGELDGKKLIWGQFVHVPSNFSAWPWKLSLDWLKREIKKLMEERSFTLEDNVPAQAERVWHIVRTLTNRRDVTHQPIAPEDVVSRIDGIIEAIPDFHIVSVEGKIRITRDHLEAIRDLCVRGQLSGSEDGMIHRPYPVPDLRRQGGAGRIANLYSDTTLRDLVEMVYANSLSIYEDLVADYFKPVQRTLRLGGALPVEFRCRLERIPQGENVFGGEAVLSRVGLPLAMGSSSQVKVSLVANGSDELGHSEDWSKPLMDSGHYRRLRPDSANWSGPTRSQERLKVFGNRPATVIAYEWLWNDLRNIGLIDGNSRDEY